MANMFFVWKDPNCNGVNPEWIQMTGKQFHEFIIRPENQKRKFIKEYVDPYNRRHGFYRFEVTPEDFRKWDASRKRNLRVQRDDMLNLPRLSAVDKDDLSAQEDYSFAGGVEDGVEDDLFFDEDTAIFGEECNSYEDYTEAISNNSDEKAEEKCEAIPFVVSLDEIVYVEEQLTMYDVIADPEVNIEEAAINNVHLQRIKELVQTLSSEEQTIMNLLYFDNKEFVSDAKIAAKLGLTPVQLC